MEIIQFRSTIPGVPAVPDPPDTLSSVELRKLSRMVRRMRQEPGRFYVGIVGGWDLALIERAYTPSPEFLALFNPEHPEPNL